MKIFILILFLRQGYGAGLTSHEFPNLESCEAALSSVYNEMKSWSSAVYGICVQKDITQ